MTSLIAHVPLFAKLSPAEIEALVATLHEGLYPAQAVLFREGEYGHRFYIILDGAIAIVKALDSADERLVALRGPGEFVGEMSLLNGDGLRTASARAHTEVRVLELTRADFDALLHRHPMLAYEMLRVMSTRLRASHDASIRDLHEKNERLAKAYAELQAAQAQLIEQETLTRELDLAREIQESMLPQQLPEVSGFDVGARMVPARMVGGDFYDMIPLGADKFGIVIGDVSGKGVPAALFMALTCSLVRAEAERSASPTNVLRNVNRQLLGMNAKGMFVTVLYGVLDRATREFSYARAGHDLPLVWSPGGEPLTIPRERGLPLALFPDLPLDAQTLVMPEDGMMLLYTDGVTEAMDAQGELFGLEQLVSIVFGRPSGPAQPLCDYLIDILAAYHGSAPQSDDITVVAVRVY